MNQRIEKLLEQCQVETYGVNGELLEIGFDAEKFAELIVKDIAEYFGREGEACFQVDGNWIAKTIRRIFGVKESQ